MRDDPPGIYLVTRAQTGDQQAWDLLVERYAPLVWSICRRYWLGAPMPRTSARMSGCG
jgi:DNA-directed RNA polymerase specialized sigma subunit